VKYIADDTIAMLNVGRVPGSLATVEALNALASGGRTSDNTIAFVEYLFH